MDHLTALKVFRTVAANGGFAAAARQMNLSPAAVSKNVAELEAHLTETPEISRESPRSVVA